MSILTQSRSAAEHTPVADRARSMLAGIDWLLLMAVAILSGWGLYTIKAGTQHDIKGQPAYYVDRQTLFLFAGLVLMVLIASINPEVLQGISWVFLGALMGSLAVVFAIGNSVKGSVR